MIQFEADLDGIIDTTALINRVTIQNGRMPGTDQSVAGGQRTVMKVSYMK